MSNRYYSDMELERAIKEAILAEPVLRSLLTYRRIAVEVQSGVATLRGHAPTSARRRIIEHIARSVPGIQRVDNHIIADDALDIQVAQALGRDPRTRPEIILVNTSQGYVYLTGSVRDEGARSAAEEVAASVPGARGIVNGIRLRGERLTSTSPRIRHVAIGSPVYSADNVRLGTVQQVVLSPRSRGLTAVIVHGAFPDPARSRPGAFPDEWPKQQRSVMIPAQHVAKATGGGTFLGLTALQAAREADADTATQLQPAGSWQPPFPYQVQDVLLEGDRSVAPALPAEAVPIELPVQSREPARRPEPAPVAVSLKRRQPVAV